MGRTVRLLLISLVITTLTTSNVLSDTGAEEVVEQPKVSFWGKKSKISIEPLQSTTCPTGWSMANVSYGEKKFTIFYDIETDNKIGWGVGPKNLRSIYTITDESNPPGPNGWKPFSPFMVKLSLSSEGDLIVSGVELLNERTYSEDSGLQKIITGNSEIRGRTIFQKMYDQLERIETVKARRMRARE